MKKTQLKLTNSILVDHAGRELAGRSRIALLERIDTLGSISSAAHELGMSYRPVECHRSDGQCGR